MVKATFTLDEDTIAQLRQAAARLKKPQSYVVRQAIQDFSQRTGRLSDQERSHLLLVLDRATARAATRPAAAVDAELNNIRAERRRWTGKPSGAR